MKRKLLYYLNLSLCMKPMWSTGLEYLPNNKNIATSKMVSDNERYCVPFLITYIRIWKTECNIVYLTEYDLSPFTKFRPTV